MESPPLLLPLLLLLLLHHHFPPQPTAAYPTFPQEALPTRSGYLPINNATGSAIFYAFYEAQTPKISNLSEVPLLIWLQGGPGCSSMTGNFYELGPWRVTSSLWQNVEHLALEPNPASWNRFLGLVFLDNPIGTGFSIAATPDEIPTDQNAVARHLSIAIKAFIASDPVFKPRPVYIAGESYAGKYVPSIGHYLVKKNAHSPVSKRVNLAGLAIGNGLTDPVTQVATHAQTAYALGLINDKQRTQLEKTQFEAVELTQESHWNHATNARTKVLNLLQNMTRLPTLYDFRRTFPYQTHLVTKFLADSRIKQALRANESIEYQECSGTVGAALHSDLMKSVKHMVESLLRKNSVRLLLYSGQCDLRVGAVGTAAWVRKMKWEGILKYLGGKREVWEVNGQLAGYVQKWRKLTTVVVLGAGHLVPADQPVNSQAMIEDWMFENGLFENEKIFKGLTKKSHGSI